MTFRRPLRAVLFGSIVSALLTGCVTTDIGGPVAPEGAEGAGLLTLENGRTYPVFPSDLAYTGTATYTWPDGREYEGRFEAGRAEGTGAGSWPNGDRYRGTWHEGLLHGHGELIRSDGSRYVGDFVSGRREGKGVEQAADGLYRGDWLADLPHGQGTFNSTEGTVYEGQWDQGERQGQGTYTDTAGNRYEGEWFADEPDGFGVMENANGAIYEGEWRTGRQQGYGRMTASSGVIYEGTWVDGSRQGFGTVRRPDGSRYEGEWLAGERHGRGRESFADGSYHDGQWQGGAPAGFGVRLDRTGIAISGEWNGDRLDRGRLELPSGEAYEGALLIRNNRAVDAGLVRWLEEKAAADDPWAHFFLGTVFSDFTDPPPDRFQATTHFRRAAEAGIPDGQFRLALLLMDPSPEEAMDWLSRAAEQNQAQANALLGEYYLTGSRVPPDLSRAIALLEAGTRAGDLTARNNLAWVLATTGDDELRDGERSVALIRPIALMLGGWKHYDTLAAAYAAVGEFDQALEAQQQAIAEAATRLGSESLEVAAMTERLNHYQSGRSIRQ
jgi:hypothetical protein